MANKEIRILVNKIEGKEPCTITVQDYSFPVGTKVKLKSNNKKYGKLKVLMLQTVDFSIT